MPNVVSASRRQQEAVGTNTAAPSPSDGCGSGHFISLSGSPGRSSTIANIGHDLRAIFVDKVGSIPG
jgi:hypothetical protein